MYENGPSEAEPCAIFAVRLAHVWPRITRRNTTRRAPQTLALGRLPQLGDEQAKHSKGGAA
jgi:hypothetical protein